MTVPLSTPPVNGAAGKPRARVRGKGRADISAARAAAYQEMLRAVRAWVKLAYPNDLDHSDNDLPDNYRETVNMLSVSAWSRAGGGHDLAQFHLTPGDDQRHTDNSGQMSNDPRHCDHCRGDRLTEGGGL